VSQPSAAWQSVTILGLSLQWLTLMASQPLGCSPKRFVKSVAIQTGVGVFIVVARTFSSVAPSAARGGLQLCHRPAERAAGQGGRGRVGHALFLRSLHLPKILSDSDRLFLELYLTRHELGLGGSFSARANTSINRFGGLMSLKSRSASRCPGAQDAETLPCRLGVARKPMVPVVRLDGRDLKLHKATVSPSLGAKTVLTNSPWEFVSLWLERESHTDAHFYWNQAREFHRASSSLAIQSAPLLHYYSFMNATKALLAAKGKAIDKRHGVRE